jgi:Uma2 family endonuclease
MRFGHGDRVFTADEFFAHSSADDASELVRGKVRMMTPAGGAHGVVSAAVFRAPDRFVEDNRFGQCFTDNTGFALPGIPHTVRSSDAAFVRNERLPAEGIGPGWISVAPDFVVEIRSPTETLVELEEELRDYEPAGTTLLWIIDPIARTVTVRSTKGIERMLTLSDTLDGGHVLPGLEIPVRRLFERLVGR